MGDIVTWQDLAVAAIVGWAVVSLYRHLRGMLSVPPAKAKAGGGGAACHGCDDCGEEATQPPRAAESR